jgi:Coenzyme PQQ synthesis protein D (PqqD)
MPRPERPAHAQQVIAQKVSNTMVLLHLGTGEYYNLDEVGLRVWELCDGTRSVPDLVSAICREFDAPPQQVEQDLLELLEELAAEQLVTEAAPPAAGPVQAP